MKERSTAQSARRKAFTAGSRVAVAALVGWLVGCAPGPRVLTPDDRRPIDRAKVEYPAGFELQRYIAGLTAPSAIAFDNDRHLLLVAESGIGGNGGPRILAFHLEDGSVTTVYPFGRQLPFGLSASVLDIHAPIGGMVVHDGRIFVSHRDAQDRGVITSLGYDGSHSTVIADLPAQGDYGVTDLTFNPVSNRLYFGVGAATNSGVVGLDNWEIGWVRDHPKVADVPNGRLALRGYRFNTSNPLAAPLLGIGDVAVTAPFQPFNVSSETKIRGAQGPTGSGKPNAAIYSIVPTGGIAGDLRVEAHGIRLPRGLGFNPFNDRVYTTNNGMELRGTRPVMDDPDALLWVVPAWYGWPDFTANLRPVTDPRFQPPREMITRTGYPDVAFIIDHEASELRPPTADRDLLVAGEFPSQSGAAKFDFVSPDNAGFRAFQLSAIVALSGDRAPFATSGKKLIAPVGYKVVSVNIKDDSKVVSDFIRNTQLGPGGDADNPQLLERPCDVKFGPDGALYILDFGAMDVREGKERVKPRTGQIFRLTPVPPATTQPANG